MQIQYVLTYVLDESKENVLCLIKKSGPSFLIGKINVPGGKIEPKESLQYACSRELFEETGLSIDSKKWINFETYISEEVILYKFCIMLFFLPRIIYFFCHELSNFSNCFF